MAANTKLLSDLETAWFAREWRNVESFLKKVARASPGSKLEAVANVDYALTTSKPQQGGPSSSSIASPPTTPGSDLKHVSRANTSTNLNTSTPSEAIAAPTPTRPVRAPLNRGLSSAPSTPRTAGGSTFTSPAPSGSSAGSGTPRGLSNGTGVVSPPSSSTSPPSRPMSAAPLTPGPGTLSHLLTSDVSHIPSSSSAAVFASAVDPSSKNTAGKGENALKPPSNTYKAGLTMLVPFPTASPVPAPPLPPMMMPSGSSATLETMGPSADVLMQAAASETELNDQTHHMFDSVDLDALLSESEGVLSPLAHVPCLEAVVLRARVAYDQGRPLDACALLWWLVSQLPNSLKGSFSPEGLPAPPKPSESVAVHFDCFGKTLDEGTTLLSLRTPTRRLLLQGIVLLGTACERLVVRAEELAWLRLGVVGYELGLALWKEWIDSTASSQAMSVVVRGVGPAVEAALVRLIGLHKLLGQDQEAHQAARALLALPYRIRTVNLTTALDAVGSLLMYSLSPNKWSSFPAASLNPPTDAVEETILALGLYQRALIPVRGAPTVAGELPVQVRSSLSLALAMKRQWASIVRMQEQHGSEEELALALFAAHLPEPAVAIADRIVSGGAAPEHVPLILMAVHAALEDLAVPVVALRLARAALDVSMGSVEEEDTVPPRVLLAVGVATAAVAEAPGTSIMESRKGAKEALRYLTAAANGDPQDSIAALQLGLHYASIRDTRSALAWTHRALELDPANPAAIHLLSLILSARPGGRPKALSTLRSALRDWPTDLPMLLTAAKLEAAVGGGAPAALKTLRAALVQWKSLYGFDSSRLESLASSWTNAGGRGRLPGWVSSRDLVAGSTPVGSASSLPVNGAAATGSTSRVSDGGVSGGSAGSGSGLGPGPIGGGSLVNGRGWGGIGRGGKRPGGGSSRLGSGDRIRAKIWLEAASGFLGLGLRADALGCIQEAAMLDDTNPDVHAALGAHARADGRPEDAQGAYERALALLPSHVPSLIAVGQALAEAGSLPQARKAFEAAVASDHGCAEAWTALGIVLNVEGDVDAAASALSTALELETSAPIVEYIRAVPRRIR